ncbi:nuclear transcription factor Y subunit B-1-like isoform X1 [Zingiber officinale]|uniref:nuclear transcription factor Y subunit B-1-like isoform X1 n=1 Tax=Zingiber officinale TaxID=94328 RepID=UPI001C4B56E5|nr:nuclear transcription factor Y subunit B-1-like isoform X1 [Zingiber officinale]
MAEASSSSTVDGAGSHESGGSVREQDRFLPIANIIRIMKKGLPANAKVAKDAKETMQECVSEFISFVTSEASDRCQKEKRKTINGDDLLWSMATLGFEDYIEPLKLYLQKYRELEGGDGTARREMGGSHPGTTTPGEYQVHQQNSLAQGMNYVNPQVRPATQEVFLHGAFVFFFPFHLVQIVYFCRWPVFHNSNY